MIAPVGGRISQGYHWYHKAIDIVDAPWGQADKSFRRPIAAPEAGTVTFVGNLGSGTSNAGLVVEVTAGSRTHRLCHLDSAAVKRGTKVKEGQLVGYMGHSGFTIPSGRKGTHLHWYLLVDGQRVDPQRYVTIPKSGSTVKKPVGHPFAKLVGKTIQLKPKNGKWRVYKENSDKVLGTLVDKNDLYYIVRGVSKRKNRVLINSRTFGKGISLPLADAKGKEYKGEYKVI